MIEPDADTSLPRKLLPAFAAGAAGGAFGVVGALLVANHDVARLADAHAGLAAWAQAVGTVIAIGAGFAVANRQARVAADREEAARQQTEIMARRFALMLAGVAVQRLQVTCSTLEQRPPRSGGDTLMLARSVQNDLPAVEAFDVLSLDDFLQIRLYQAIAGLLGTATDRIGMFQIEAERADASIHELTRMLLVDLQSLMRTSQARLATFQASLGMLNPEEFP